MPSKSLRDLDNVKSTVLELVDQINKQNDVIQKLAFMIASLHIKVYPELYDEDGKLREQNETIDQEVV